MRNLAILALLATPAAAQLTFTLPGNVLQTNNNLPFAGGIGRYQQWFRGSDLAANATQPMRMTQIDFLRGSGSQQVATTLDLEVAVGHSFQFGPNGLFDQNFVGPRLVVVPRRTVMLGTGNPGSVVLSFPFVTPFTWDGQSPVIIDVKVFGNGQGNQVFNYDFLSTSQGLGAVTRLYALGNANATAATTVQSNWGLFARFTMRPGVNLPFGSGCPGEGNFVPTTSTSQLAWPGIGWNHQLSNASSQRLAIWVLGLSRTQWGPAALPLDLGPVIGAQGCTLLASPDLFLLTQTVGGGAGAGIANISLQLPPVTVYIGKSLFTQWLVLDPLANNGVGAASAGIWSIVAPIGG
jgi:hypothetical protein